jgi:AcrR family transcriptional regulator
MASAARSRRPARPRRTGRRAQHKAAVRDRIVRAALALFQTKGFEATTTRAIARRAGIAEGTVFNYFATKEDIALFFFELEVDHAIATVRSDRRMSRAPLEEKLFVLVQSQLEYLAPHERFIGAAFIEALKPSSPLGAFSVRALEVRTKYLAFVGELFAQSLPAPSGAPIAWVGSQAFWIFYLGILLFWLNDTSPGKQQTMAFLDRALTLGVAMFRQGSTPWRGRDRRRPAAR